MLDKELYEDLLGKDWDLVHQSVRSLHLSNGQKKLAAQGLFKISHGTNVITKSIAWLMGMPKVSDACPIKLMISKNAEKEIWSRSFGNKPMISSQWKTLDHFSLERFGLFQFILKLKQDAGGIVYEQQSFGIGIGRHHLKFPPILSPSVLASEKPSPNKKNITASIKVSIPLFGLLLSYEGDIVIDATTK